MIYIGIDPGQQGAIGIIYPSRTNVHDMPKFIASQLFELLRQLDISYPSEPLFCMLEQAQPMPKQGVKGVFTYGIGYGKIKAVLEILEIPFQEIHPAKWKKEFSLFKKGKEGAIKTAQQLFPSISFQTERGRWLDGRAEALLLAEYARRHHQS